MTLPDTLLDRLRSYWTHCRPEEWLFPSSRGPSDPICLSTAQRVFANAKCRAGINKIGGIHSLRHAYATHQLENGLPVHELQRLLGHNNLQSTERYLHWLPGCCGASRGYSDLLAHIGAMR
ncbi:MAG: tyrosine-type recombinase/integrase [Xanthomonadales bacterium]|nr:tyrosine-type recombinase/integrase [Xanthomonadales bacterium]